MQLSLIVQALALAIVGTQLSPAVARVAHGNEITTAAVNEILNNAEFTDHEKLDVLRRRISEDDEHDGHDDHDDHDHGDEKKDREKPWGLVLGSTFLINLVTLSGVVFFIPALFRKKSANSSELAPNSIVLDIFIPAFAAGALLSTILFLVLPESVHLLNDAVLAAGGGDSHDDHRILEGDDAHDEHEGNDEHGSEIAVGAIWRLGAAILGGFLLHLVMGAFFPHPNEPPADAVKVVNFNKEDLDEEKADQERSQDLTADSSTASNKIDYSLCLAILIGDGFHNFCDGIFVGVAFMLCDRTTAWTIAFVTLYHEIAQEIADFFMLTRHGGLTVKNALILNFVAGLSVVLGGILVLSIDVSDMTIGIILAMTCGVYIQIAATECMSRAQQHIVTNKDRAIALAAFTIGSVPIGLTLLGHEHC